MTFLNLLFIVCAFRVLALFHAAAFEVVRLLGARLHADFAGGWVHATHGSCSLAACDALATFVFDDDNLHAAELVDACHFGTCRSACGRICRQEVCGVGLGVWRRGDRLRIRAFGSSKRFIK